MGIVLENAFLADLDPVRVELGSLRIEGGLIAEHGASVSRNPGDQIINCDGSVVLPGMVNGHGHLYSALAVGMPPPPKQPGNFREILEQIWWRLDRALDPESIEVSAQVGAMGALRCGTTTIIDHHASPCEIAGSLDLIESGLSTIGLRGVLCYETTDRNGRQGCKASIEENRRYLAKCRSNRDGCFGAVVGAHAAFTLEDETLDELASLADEFETGVHIHVAEDACDDELCRSKHGGALIDRLANHGILRPASIFAHGIHLDARAIDQINEVRPTIAHNPRSNMNNAVGHAPLGSYTCPVMLGTDGIGNDMLAEAQATWFAARHTRAAISPTDILTMLAASARRASDALGITLGRLKVGATADILLTDYRPYTPLDDANLPVHLLFAIQAEHVASVLIDGRWALRDRTVCVCDEKRLQDRARRAARQLWKKMGDLK